eukprot:TRINITY_DN93711_c0_g1_i1.p1 TRINITY_DN93711_c0_g1~~TRINITY_DN93711_c0_g1_i1.p1  ORF type:complete len:431 (-),score=68.26 TRINITY_DN93711_c0_g1_i1:72-1280(-)
MDFALVRAGNAQPRLFLSRACAGRDHQVQLCGGPGKGLLGAASNPALAVLFAGAGAFATKNLRQSRSFSTALQASARLLVKESNQESFSETERAVRRSQPWKPSMGQDLDARFAQLEDDPRCHLGAKLGKAQRAALGERGLVGRNSASFDPASTLVRPAMRVCFGSPTKQEYGKTLRHDDVVVVPDFFCAEDDWNIYYSLLQEMRSAQAEGLENSQWESWHEGAHLLSPNPEGSQTYHIVLRRMCKYFSIAPGRHGTRFNWYCNGSDWKPFHHDSAAFNRDRAKNQNCTVGVSFGSSRELAFRHAGTGELIYFPQTNGMLFFFGRDVNIRWQHGINALPQEQQDEKGRISIILWGNSTAAVEERGSPPMLSNRDRPGHFSVQRKGKGRGKGKVQKADATSLR